MKIGIITNLYPPYVRGGAEHVVVRSVESFMERGHDVFVITGQPKNQGTDVQQSPTAMERVYRFFPRNLYFILDDYKHRWLTRLVWHIVDALCYCGARNVRKVLEEEQPEIVMTHNLKGIGLRIPRVMQRKGIPHVHVVHDLQLIYPSGLLFAGKEDVPWHTKPFYGVYRAICRQLFGKPDLVIFPSSYLKEQYLKHGFFKESEVKVMPNPAPDFEVIERSERNTGPLRLLFVGQLEEHKGVRFLLDAMKQLPVNAQLIVAGEGRMSDVVQARADADKRITYLGYVALDQLVRCLSVADALVVPSLCYENSPTVIYEALQAGIPVLASDIGGVGELVENGKNGFLFSPNDTEDFYRALLDIDEKKEYFGKHQDELKATISGYALSAYTDKLIELFSQLKK